MIVSVLCFFCCLSSIIGSSYYFGFIQPLAPNVLHKSMSPFADNFARKKRSKEDIWKPGVIESTFQINQLNPEVQEPKTVDITQHDHTYIDYGENNLWTYNYNNQQELDKCFHWCEMDPDCTAMTYTNYTEESGYQNKCFGFNNRDFRVSDPNNDEQMETGYVTAYLDKNW